MNEKTCQIEVSARGGARVHALCSPEDFDRLSGKYWQLGTDGYPRRQRRKEDGPNAPGRIAMHREVVGLHRVKGKAGVREVDHKNRNRLDCRRDNLRICNRGLNSTNLAGRGKSRFLGVSYHFPASLWRGYVSKDGKQTSAGYFKSEEAAARARDRLAVKLYGADATLNFGSGQ